MTVIHLLGAAARSIARLEIVLSIAVLVLFVVVALMRPAHAMDIKTVKSPGGIEAWLVEDRAVPLVALRFAFGGGSSQDPVGKEGVANFLSAMLDEGAGDLPSADFQERMEDIAMRMSYEDGRDTFYGNVETLSAYRDQAMALLKLALTKPRFDADAVERIRGQLQAGLAYADRDPDRVASKAWFKTAFPGHPYGREPSGSSASLAAIGSADLEAFRKSTFARDNLKVVAVGDIDAASLGKLLDEVFGDLPATAALTPVAETMPPKGGKLEVVEMDVPQSVAVFGGAGLKRKDPDFIAAFVLNHILGGGGFSSKLMEEVREKRGLAYSVYSYLSPLERSAVYLGSVATKNEEIGQSLDVIRAELTRIATDGPSPQDLDGAKKYLIGSFALRFDTNSKIASQLLGLLVEGFDKDYIEKRNGLIEAVTLADIKRAAARFLTADDLIVTVVGKPQGLPPRG
ncbi:MAG: pitrilysin family protein [Hyphomicrobiaceae bacterium]|nr:pitrilysin family protein [Hyphomicrobiaceae bacterium]